jgi:hypothetical protein
VAGTLSGSCPEAGFGLAVLNLPILLPELISNMSLSGEVVRMERGWEWLRIVYNGRL